MDLQIRTAVSTSSLGFQIMNSKIRYLVLLLPIKHNYIAYYKMQTSCLRRDPFYFNLSPLCTNKTGSLCSGDYLLISLLLILMVTPKYGAKEIYINTTRFFLYKNTENGARLDVLSISRFQSLKMFLKC